jgi:hypothetical protein
MTFTGTPSASLNDSAGKKRFILNGKLAKHSSGSNLTYRLSPGLAGVCLDNGPYNNIISDTNPLTLAYNVPTSTTHDNSDDDTIHIRGTYASVSTGGFGRIAPANAAEDTKVSIKFDNASFSYAAPALDFIMATAQFRGIELPVTGTTTYGSSVGFTTDHYAVVVFAATNGELSTISNGVQLDAYSLEIKAGARLRVSSNASNPAIIKTQTEPKIAGVWSFESLSSHTFSSPRSNPVTSVANGGTGLPNVPPNNLLMGSSASGMAPLTKIPPGVNGQVLTLTSGVPGWAASSGGGGSGTLTSVATTAPITGGTITTTGTIGISAATTSAAGSMSSADKTKLDTVETNADVTDTTNVTAAGALMDSEVTNLADVKAFDPADYATAGQGNTADAALPKAGGTMTGEIEATTITLNAVPADPATDGKVRIGESGGTSNMFQIQTNDGYIQIGPNNGTYAHLYSDRAQFYFSRPVLVDGGGQIFAFNDGLKLGTGTTASGGTVAITVADGSTDITVAGSIAVGGTVDGIDIATDVAANTAKVTNATHSGEVTGATALTIADNVVDEANLKVSNTPTNGYALTAQSGASGGLTWAAMSGGAPALQYLRLFMKNLSGNANNYTLSSNGVYVIMDIANTTNWGESTTGTHNDITVTNATSDHITLAAGGLYHIIATVEFFPAGSTNRDMWLVLSTDASSTGQLGTARSQNGVANLKLQHSVYHEVASGGSDDDIYFSIRSNGATSNIIAFNDNRSTIQVTRVGDSTV